MLKLRKIDDFIQVKKRHEPDPAWWLYSEILSDVFGEIIDKNSLLQDCYCEIRTRKFDESFIKSVTTGIPGAIFCDPDINPNDFLSEYLPKTNLNNPILILGDVGTGKSTYVHHFFKVTLKRLKLDEKILSIILDLKNRFIPPTELRHFIDDGIHNYLEKYSVFIEPSIELSKSLFADEIRSNFALYNKLRELSEKEYELRVTNDILDLKRNQHLYNVARIKYLNRKLQKQLFIVIDNVDHHARDYQVAVFNICRTLMEDYGCPFILTTRYYTFPVAYKYIGLSSFQPRFLNLSLPDTKDMLKRRTDYLFQLNFEDTVKSKIKKDCIKVFIKGRVEEVRVGDLKDRLNKILDALLTEKVMEMLLRLSDYDLRMFLKMVKIALSSQFIYPPEREARDRNGEMYVRYFDLLKAIMQGNNWYYDPTRRESLIILNLFCTGDKGYDGNNLLRIRILQCLDCFGDNIYIGKVYEFMRSIGYEESRVKEEMEMFLQLDLVESPVNEGYDLKIHNIQFLQLTHAGKYYLRELIKEPTYLDTVKFATYIDPADYYNIFDILKGVKNDPEERKIARMLSTEAFINYIQKEEEREKERITERNLNLENYKIIDTIYYKLKSSYDELKEKILPFSPELEL